MVKNSPFWISRSMPATATTSPKCLVRPAKRISGVGVSTPRTYPVGSGKQGQIRPGRLAGATYGSGVDLVAERVAGGETDVVEQFFVPARSGAGGVAGGVPAEAGDFGVGVSGIGPDGDPAAFAADAPTFHRPRGKRAFEEFATVQRVAHGARAVVAAVPPFAVAAAVDV